MGSTSIHSRRRVRFVRAVGVVAGGVAAGLLALAASLPASGEVRTDDGSVPLTSLPSTQAVELDQFDGADGTLTRVTLTVSVAARTDLAVTNMTRATKTTVVSLESPASISGPGLVEDLAAAVEESQSRDLAAGETVDFGLSGTDDQVAVLTDPADLAPFVGTDTVTFEVTGWVDVDVEGPATWRSRGTASGTATVRVDYEFTPSDDPPVAVDDAATVAEDAAATAVDVLANDTDADGGPIGDRHGHPAGQRHGGHHR